MSLTRKLPLVIVGLALAASLVTGFLALTNFERELKRSEQSQLVALLEARGAELTRFFARMRAGLHLYARNPAVQEAMAEFSSAHATLDLAADASAYLTRAFRADGGWTTGDAEGDQYADYYRQVHDEFHPWLLETRINWDLNDLMLIDPQGNLVYTSAKRRDFTASLVDGPLAESALGAIYRRIKPNPTGVTTTYSDLVAYGPAGGAPVLFVGAPVFSRTGTWIGIVVLEIPVAPINAILSVKRGMGLTGETYLVGADGLMRSQARLAKEASALKIRVDGSTFHLALTGDTGVGIADDYRGRRVYSAYAPLALDDFRWVLLSEIDEDEVLARVRSARSDILWILVSTTALLLLIGTFLARRIARPIRRVTKAMTALAEGNLDVKVYDQGRGDEIGLLVRSFETLRENEVERRRLGEEVRKQNRIAQAALENMGQALVMVDGGGRLVARNARFAEQFDLTGDQVGDGRPFADLAEDLSACVGIDAGAEGRPGEAAARQWIRQSTGRAGADSIEMALADGRTYEVRHMPLAQGGFVQTYTNITERKENEERLRENERQLGQILDSSPVGAGISRLSDGRIMFVNRRQCELLGVTMDKMMRRARSDFYPDLERADELTRRFADEGAVHGFEIDIRRGDGSAFPALVSMLPLEYGGDTCRLVWIFDLSDIKAAQAEVARSHERMIAILEMSPIGVAIARRDGGGMLYANARQAELLGVDLDTYLSGPQGAYWADPADRARVNEVLLREGEIQDAEVRMRRADGGEFWALVSGFHFDYGGEPARMGWFYDITQRKEAERRLNEAYEVISSSIQYASRIQRSILPDPEVFETLFADHFVHWEPRDVVGGDVYWCAEWGGGALVVLGDCTGHGVPGAFMTLIAIGALDRALAEVPEGQVARLMQRMHQLVQVTLNQHGSGGESDDGMELGICYLPGGGAEMTYVGARFSLFVEEDGQVREIKGDRTGIGYRHVAHDVAFTEVPVALGPGRSFYMTSDGLVDQLGGAKRRSFGKRRFKDLIAAFEGEGFAARRERIMRAFAAYQGDETRRDDVAVLGFTLDGAGGAPTPA